MIFHKIQSKLTLQKQAPKILKICPSIDNTYVYITTCNEPFDEEKIVHVDSKGRVIWEQNYQDSIDTFGMFNQREVIILNVAKGRIDIIDLATHLVKPYKHNFSFPDTSYMDIHTFYDTRFLCVQESGPIGEGKLLLTYYRYTSQQFETISQYRSKETEWTYEHHTSKANNHSKVAWWKQSFTDEIQFSFWDLQKSPSGALSTVKIRNTLPAILGVQNITVCISHLWESASNKYSVACNTSNNREGYFKRLLVVDQVSSIISQSKFSPHRVLPSLGSVYDIFNLKTFSVILSQKMVGGKAEESPIYFVDNESQKLIDVKDSWKASNLSHFYLPGYDHNSFIEAIHENGNVKEVTVLTHNLMTLSEIYLFFMLGINQDFDDDLLQDALQILGCINE